MAKEIHASSIVHRLAKIEEDVEIGPFCIIHQNVEIGRGTKIGAYCELGVATPLANGSPLVVGRHSVVRSHSVFYESSQFGPELITGHRVTVREHSRVGSHVQIGTLSEIQGDCTIGDHVRFQSSVFVGKMSLIGNFVWMFPYSVLTNDRTPPSEALKGVVLGDYSVISANAVVLAGVQVGKHALIAASACVASDVPAFSIAAGVPARILGNTAVVKLKNRPDVSAYPWPTHFRRGYPANITQAWDDEFGPVPRCPNLPVDY